MAVQMNLRALRVFVVKKPLRLCGESPAPHSRATQLIAAGDREIDELVYALYGLSEDDCVWWGRVIRCSQLHRSILKSCGSASCQPERLFMARPSTEMVFQSM